MRGDVGFAVGSRLAGYRLEERIGQGGMAVVYRARDEQLDRLVALKILAPALAGDDAFQRRFVRESRAAAAIDDPNIVPVYAAGEADGVLYLAMRYVAGGDAMSLLKREGSLPAERVAAIISPVASALDAAHGAGLLHRDVKPSNMLVDSLPGRPDHVYLSDFGLSKAMAATTSGVTRAGEVLGTVAYMSPEQLSGEQADGRADQYALACSAFELLSGSPPFRRDEPMAEIYAHMKEPPPTLSSRRPGTAGAVDDVLAKALAKTPAERYATCGQFADALREALGFQPYSAVPAAARPVRPPHPPTEVVVTGLDEEQITRSSIPPASGDTGPVLPYEPAMHGIAPPPPRRRLMMFSIIAAVVVVAAGGLTAGLLAGSKPKPKPPAPPLIAVPIAVHAKLAPIDGYTVVVYDGDANAVAQINGQVKKAANGEVVRLYAQVFPFKHAPVLVGSDTLHPSGGLATYQFSQSPTFATRYQVKLFRSGAARAAFGISAVTTVYVTIGETWTSSRKCGRPVCHESMTVTNYVPPSAMATVMSQTWYPYFALNLDPKKEPPAPKFLTLNAGNGHISAARQIAPNEFSQTVTYSFQVGNDGLNWAWNTCVRDIEAQNGLGLPGHHGCGDTQIAESASYLG